jgi:hypothetical protein
VHRTITSTFTQQTTGSVPPPTTVTGPAGPPASSHAVPTYATACSGSVRYSSACSCFGATASTMTVPGPTNAVTSKYLIASCSIECAKLTSETVSVCASFYEQSCTDYCYDPFTFRHCPPDNHCVPASHDVNNCGGCGKVVRPVRRLFPWTAHSLHSTTF